MDFSFSEVGCEAMDDSSVKLLTKNFLQRSSRLQTLPACLRSEMMKRSLSYDMEENQELKRRPDACRNCGVILDRTSTLIMIQRQKNRREKNKKTPYRKLLRVGCSGCGWKSSGISLPQSKSLSNDAKVEELDSNTSHNTSNSHHAIKRTPFVSSFPSTPPAPQLSANKSSASGKARKNNKVNKLRNMIASSSGPTGASLSDFLFSLSK